MFDKKAYDKEYYKTHKEEIAIRTKEYRANNMKELAISKKAYYENHKEERAIKNKEYYKTHKEEYAARMKEYYEDHKGELLTKNKEYYENHKEGRAIKGKEYRDNHKEEGSANKRAYLKTPKGREVQKRTTCKRKRELGYNVLTPIKEGETGHHITNEDVIGIPEQIHTSFGGHNRKKHRTLVLQWLKGNDKPKYKVALCALAANYTFN